MKTIDKLQLSVASVAWKDNNLVFVCRLHFLIPIKQTLLVINLLYFYVCLWSLLTFRVVSLLNFVCVISAQMFLDSGTKYTNIIVESNECDSKVQWLEKQISVLGASTEENFALSSFL